jgi:BirA family biotin operon repressor/biotin-[acetyl-CoA-carboxylase] ligase
VHRIHFDTLGSTNTWAKEHASQLDPARLTCITASEQTAGRGRMRRRWLSPKDLNLYATLFFCVPKNTPCIVNCGQLLAFSCATVLQRLGFSPQIKWPNDLLLEGKKVAGVLAETASFLDRTGVILGVGVNVNMPQELLDAIDQPATSLARVSGRSWPLASVLDPLLAQFLQDKERLLHEGFPSFQRPLEALLAYRGQPIRCQDGAQVIQGVCRGIDAQGCLRVQLPSGALRSLTAGELTHAENSGRASRSARD